MSSVRVLHVLSGVGTGGAESFLANLAPRLMARGIEQRIVSLTGDGPSAYLFEKAGIPVDRLDMRGVFKAPMVIRALARIIEKFDASVVQGWMYHGDLAALLAHRLARHRSSRLMWNIRCSDMNLDRYALQLRLVIGTCSKLSKVPDVVIVNSQAGADAHMAAGYTPRRLEIIHNGVDCRVFRPDTGMRRDIRNEFGLDDSRPVIIHPARADPMKDHATLLRALSRLEGVTTLLVGLGTDTMELPPGVIGLGRRNDMARILTGGDIVVSSSAFGEGFSNATAEGMASGLVPIATDVGDVAQIIGDTGHVVPPRDSPALFQALQQELVHSRAVLSKRGQQARARIVGNFTLERSADRYEALYLEDRVTQSQAGKLV